MIYNKSFFDQPGKTKRSVSKACQNVSRNDDCITGNFLDHFYHENWYKLIGVDLSRQTNKTIHQKIDSA